MKILFVIDSLKFGGAQRQLVELVKGLAPRGHELHLIYLKRTRDSYVDEIASLDVARHCFPRRFKFDARPLFKTLRYIRRHRIDLVHSFMTLGSLIGVSAARLCGVPVICSALRDARDIDWKMALSHRLLSRLATVFVSNSMTGFTNRFKELKPHYRVVYNGLDRQRFEHPRDAAWKKQELGLGKFTHVIGMVASLSIRKDHGTLLRAAVSVLAAFPGACFLLVGDGENRARLRRQTEETGLSENVIFLGARTDVEDIIPLMDLSVLLSDTDVHLEGISNTILESMALGVPVAATAGGGTNELITHGINGVLVPPKAPEETARAIIALLKDKATSRRLADTALADVRRRFSMHRYITDYEALYQANRRDPEKHRREAIHPFQAFKSKGNQP